MKKLMIAAAIVCAAALSQAATFQWKAGSSVKGPGADGTFSTTTLTKGSFDMYVWLVDSDTYNDLAIADIYSNYKGQTASATKGVWGSTTIAGVTASTAAEDSTTYYGVVLMTYTDTDNKEWYIANKATGTTDATGSGKTINALATKIGGTGDAITGWTAAAVPEPTSGLLLLLGVAGLALRRCRA